MFILKQLRRKKNINQTDLALAIGVSLRTIQLYEKKDANIPIKNLTKIAQYFDVTIAELYSHEVNEDAQGYGDRTGGQKGTETRLIGHGKILMDVPLLLEADEQAYLTNVAKNEGFVNQLPRMSFVLRQEEEAHHMAFEVAGRSMDNGTLSGVPMNALVLGKEITLEALQQMVTENSIYIIVHSDGILCKAIQAVNKETKTIHCHSYNKSPEYVNFSIEFGKVLQLFEVVKKQIDC